ncbi:acyl carrier protein [Solirubrobacter taibaiensis]|nr:acyl carrier protein [Solirubrobacter taibaiensis]
MSEQTQLSAATVMQWLAGKLAERLGTDPAEVDVNQYFDDFDLDSTEALILAGEMETWLGYELETTALWYHPTIASLAEYIAEEHTTRAPQG